MIHRDFLRIRAHVCGLMFSALEALRDALYKYSTTTTTTTTIAKATHSPILEQSLYITVIHIWIAKYSLINFCTRSLLMLKPSIACRLVSESEKIMKFFNFDRRITLIASNKAYTSARKMLVRSGTRTLLVMPLYTIAEARATIAKDTRSPILEPSLYTLQ